MISLQFKSTFAISLICFVLGCILSLLLLGNCGGTRSGQPVITTAIMKAQADSLQHEYHASISVLENENAKLIGQLKDTREELTVAKSKTKNKAASIKKLIHTPGYPARDLKKLSDSLNVNAGSTQCDSLVQLVTDYLQDSQITDSLYEVQAMQQDSLLEVKEKTIQLQQHDREKLALLLQQSLSVQNAIARDNHKLQKRIRKQRTGSKILALGTAILSGLATHYLTR